MARSLRRNDIDNYNGTNTPGSYQRTHLNNIINNFMVGYVGDDKVLTNVPRHEIAFHAQRAIQEFSYDVFHADKAIELEYDPSGTLAIPLPPDYVNYVEVTRIDENGNARVVKPSFSRKPSQAAVQDEDYNVVFDDKGDIVYAQQSESQNRFRNYTYDENFRAIDYYNGYYYNDDFSYYNQKRFGLQTHLANQDYTYMIDNTVGLLYLNSAFAKLGETGNIPGQARNYITLRYISDGLGDGDDLDNVYVPKLCEDAIYATIMANLCKVRGATQGVAPMYMKEAKAKRNNAKIRLMNFKSQEVIDLMRMKSKWIKH